jgi:SAM-dependent methyltransferase
LDKSFLVRFFGFPATLIHGDLTVLDRWRWLRRYLPVTSNGEKLLDVGCGSGAFSIGAARRGYKSLGLSWDKRNQSVATERASLCNAEQAAFEVCDVRNLHERQDLKSEFDVVLCLENMEHVMDDARLMRAISGCLKPGGFLLFTAPFQFYRPLNKRDRGPFSRIEDGGHVRPGYTFCMLEELCTQAGLRVELVESCSGFFSQKITALQRWIDKPFGGMTAWVCVLPLRPLPILLDSLVHKLFAWPNYSICLVAYKPRLEPRSCGTP